MATVINAIRTTLFYLYLIVSLLFVGIFCAPIRWFAPKLSRAVAKIWLSSGILAARYLCGIRYRVEGLENIPADTPVILASQHQSAWETFHLPTMFNMPAMIFKQELLKIPVFGDYLRYSEMVAVDRNGGMAALRDMVEQVKAKLAEGRHILIFPEGTRIAPGQKARLHPGIAAIHAECRSVPVIPVTLNSGLYWPKDSLVKKPGLITVQFHPPLPADLKKQEMLEALARVYYE